MRGFTLLFVIVTALSVPASAQDADIYARPSPQRMEAPVTTLPAHITAPEGAFAIVADFDNAVDGSVPIYIVNRTRDTILLGSDNGDVLLKLEYEVSPGVWKRAQPHVDKCNNDYVYPIELYCETFVRVEGFMSRSGTVATVRYGLYRQAVAGASNPGIGLVNERDVELAANDAMAVSSGDFEFVAAIARGEITPHNTLGCIQDLRMYAIMTLAHARFDRQKAVHVLQEIVNRNLGTYSDAAAKRLAYMRKMDEAGGR